MYIWKALNWYHISYMSPYLEIAFIWSLDYWLGSKNILHDKKNFETQNDSWYTKFTAVRN